VTPRATPVVIIGVQSEVTVIVLPDCMMFTSVTRTAWVQDLMGESIHT